MGQILLKIREVCGFELESRVKAFAQHIAFEKSERTAESYLFDIWLGLRFFKYQSWEQVTGITIEEFRGFCAQRRQEGISIASQQRMVIAWKIFLRWAQVKTIEDFKVPKVPKRYPRPIVEEIIEFIIEMKGDWKAIRNKGLWLLMYGSGMRISEALSLRVADVDERAVLIRGKGQMMRLVLLLPKVREALIEYLERRPVDSELLFITSSGDKLSQQNAAQIFRRWCDKMGLDRKITLHSLRHGFATQMLKGGCPLPGLQKLLGHSQVGTTAKYVKIEDAQLEEKLNKIDL